MSQQPPLSVYLFAFLSVRTSSTQGLTWVSVTTCINVFIQVIVNECWGGVHCCFGKQNKTKPKSDLMYWGGPDAN